MHDLRMIGTGIIIVSLVILGIWVLIEIKRMKHKLFAIFLILLILFAYISYTIIMKNNDIDLKTIDGLTKVTKIYFSWMGSAFSNIKVITTNAINMDWTGKKDIGETNSTKQK